MIEIFTPTPISKTEKLWEFCVFGSCASNPIYRIKIFVFRFWHFSFRSYPPSWNFKNVKSNWMEFTNQAPKGPIELYVFWFFGSSSNTLVNLLKKYIFARLGGGGHFQALFLFLGMGWAEGCLRLKLVFLFLAKMLALSYKTYHPPHFFLYRTL